MIKIWQNPSGIFQVLKKLSLQMSFWTFISIQLWMIFLEYVKLKSILIQVIPLWYLPLNFLCGGNGNNYLIIPEKDLYNISW